MLKKKYHTTPRATAGYKRFIYYGIVLFVVIVPSSAMTVETVEFWKSAEVIVQYKKPTRATGTAIDTRATVLTAVPKRAYLSILLW